MAMDFYDSINGDGYFDLVGKACFAISTLNTARLTTVPTQVVDFLIQTETLAGADLDYQAAMTGVPGAVLSWQNSGGTLTSALRSACEKLLIEYVQDDSEEPAETLTASLEWLVEQMKDRGYYVAAPTIAITVTADTDNVGNASIAYTTRRGDGQVNQNILAENIAVEVVNDTSDRTPYIEFVGEERVSDRLSHLWPDGSGCNTTITATDASGSLVTNGNFEDTTIADIPDGWTVVTGTPGTTIRVTDYAVQAFWITGTPTGGSYVLYYTNAQSIQRVTEPLAYNATSATVQAALRLLPGLEDITVAQSGSSPNYTHTITMTGVPGAPTVLSSSSLLTGGTPVITHATAVAGDAGAFLGRALRIIGNGTEYTALYTPLTLEPETVYFLHGWFKTSPTGEEESSSSSSSLSSSSSSSLSSSSSSSPSSSSSSSVNSSSSSSSSKSTSSSSSVNSSSSSSSMISSASASSNSSSSSVNSSSSSSESSTSTSSSSMTSSSSTSSKSSLSSQSASSGSSSSTSSVNSSSSSSSKSSGSSTSSSSSSESAVSASSSSSSSSQYGEEVRLEIVDGIGGNVTLDTEGIENALRIDLDSLSGNDHHARYMSFRLARTYTHPVYLRVRVSSTINSGRSLYLNELAVVAGRELYAGGPYVAAFPGDVPAVTEDQWTMAATSTASGSWQQWFNRLFGMADRGLLLPTVGTTLIPTTPIA